MFIHGEGELLVPAHLNFGKFILDQLRQVDPDRTCLHNCTRGERLSYGEFVQHALKLSAALAQAGARRGDAVAVGGEPRAAFLPTGLAAILAGAHYIPIYLHCGKVILTHKLNLTKPKFVICSRLFWESYKDVLKALDFIQTLISFEAIEDIPLCVETMMSSPVDVATFQPAAVNGTEDLAIITYSSGTTGMSKGVMLTHMNCLMENNLYLKWLKDFDSLPTSQALRTVFFPDPDNTTYDIFMITAFICSGKTVIYSEDEVNLQVIQEYKVNAMPTVPAVIEMMLDAKKSQFDYSSLKLVYAAGSTMRPRSTDAFRERYPDIKLVHLYGASEVGAIASTQNMIVTSTNEATTASPSSVGEAVPGAMIKVVDLETREALGPNQRREICVQSPRLMKGYLGATSPHLDEQGFYMTGDLGYFDDDKCFYLVDRLKDVIVFLGYKVCPAEVEAVLLLHPAVREAAVLGTPVGVEGERVAAAVVLQPALEATEADLQNYVAQKMAWYMQLNGGVRFVSELPRNSNGKILRRQLREIFNVKEDLIGT